MAVLGSQVKAGVTRLKEKTKTITVTLVFWDLSCFSSSDTKDEHKSDKVIFDAAIFTVNSLYCGHPRDRDLVSLIARVRNSGNLFQSNICDPFLPGV